MPIDSSSYAVDAHAQRDGRRYVTELHTDSTGEVHRVDYGPVHEVDYEAIMIERAALLSAQLADAEAQAQWL